MKRVEFVGPPGAGKSTLFRKLATLLPHHWWPDEVRTARDAKRRILAKGFTPAGSAKRMARRIVYSVPAFRHELVVERVPKTGWDCLDEREVVLAPLLRHVLYGTTATGMDEVHNLQRMLFFIRDVTDLVLLERYGNSEVVLHDESLLHRGLGFGYGDQDARSFLERYCDLAPVLDLVVYVYTEPDLLRERIHSRSGSDSPWLHRTEDAISLASLVIERVQSRGAEILSLDGADEYLGENTATCLAAVQRLYDDQSRTVAHRRQS